MPFIKKLSASFNWGTVLLKVAFGAVLAGRVLFPFYYNPIDQLYSDMQRHVDNGIHLFHPNFLGGSDPKAYQLYVYLLHNLSQGSNHRFYCALITGLLCASMAWFWYKALREMLTRNKALAVAIVLGIHPTLLCIYGFFMTETLLLTALALATWMMLRAIRKRTLRSFLESSLCWALVAFTKQTGLPIMLMGMTFALLYQPKPLRAFAMTAIIFIILIIPASLHSFMGLHFFAPFGFSGKETIIRKSDHAMNWFLIFETPYNESHWWWLNPSLLNNPLSPLGTYTSKRSKDKYMTQVQVWQGKGAWKMALDELEDAHSWTDVLHEYEENVIYFFFASSWPDSNPENNQLIYNWSNGFGRPGDVPKLLMYFNYHLRWLWFPSFLLLFTYGMHVKLSPQRMWFLMVTVAVTCLFMLQDVSIVEGRYRKPLEPFLMISIFFMAEAAFSRKATGDSMVSFIRDYYVYPFLRQLIGPVFPPKTAAETSLTSAQYVAKND